MATTANHLSSTRRTRSGQLKRRLMTAAAATFAMLFAEYGRAVAAAERYDGLKYSGPLGSRPIGAGSIPRTIFEEFYSRPAGKGDT